MDSWDERYRRAQQYDVIMPEEPDPWYKRDLIWRAAIGWLIVLLAIGAIGLAWWVFLS